MFNLIKAQQYRTLRDNATYIVILVGVIFHVFCQLVNMQNSAADQFDAGHLFLMSASTFSFVGNMLLMALTSLICGSDMLDKTINYEPLDGAKRSTIYFSRFILSLCWGLGAVYAIILLPEIFMGLFAGWGNVISVAGFARRMAIMIFPFIRAISLYTALTFLIGDYRAVFAIGFIFSQFELLADMLIQEITKLPPFVRAFFSVSSMNVLLDVENIGFDYLDAEDISVVKDSLTASDNIICAAICAVMAAAILFIGLALFKKKDMK